VIRGVVFDFDGLVLDTELPVYRSWSEVYEQHGVELELDVWQSIIGTDSFDPMEYLEAKLGRSLDWEPIQARRRARRDSLQAREVARPGVLSWLSSALDLRLALGVASSSPRVWVVDHLTQLGLLDRFGCIRCRDDVGVAKPSPDSYLAVLDAFGLEPDEAVGIEDSVHGVTAVKAAGMRCIAVPNALTQDMDFSAADLVLDSLADLSLADALAKVS
jgi:HAD superfamily hydrolase (TIGR01509 family)